MNITFLLCCYSFALGFHLAYLDFESTNTWFGTIKNIIGWLLSPFIGIVIIFKEMFDNLFRRK